MAAVRRAVRPVRRRQPRDPAQRAELALAAPLAPPLRTGRLPLLRFGVFDVDPTAGELRKRGRRLRLQEKPFQLLVSLLERPGEVITREALRLRLWSSDTFVDFDNGLNNAVNKLRTAVGDSAQSPRYIETVGRRLRKLMSWIKAKEVD